MNESRGSCVECVRAAHRSQGIDLHSSAAAATAAVIAAAAAVGAVTAAALAATYSAVVTDFCVATGRAAATGLAGSAVDALPVPAASPRLVSRADHVRPAPCGHVHQPPLWIPQLKGRPVPVLPCLSSREPVGSGRVLVPRPAAQRSGRCARDAGRRGQRQRTVC